MEHPVVEKIAEKKEKLPLLSAREIRKYYPVRRGLFQESLELKAVDGVSLEIYPGETLSIVGESGSGKSTLARQILRMEKPTSGEVYFHGENILQMSETGLPQYWKQIQLIFQNPYSSLNPRWKVGKIIGEPLALHTSLSSSQIKEKILGLMKKVGLSEEHIHRYPHQFSGGQRQRIGIARALALQPEIIICDEPVSALDVSIQSQILNLLMDLQAESKLSYLLISHDLSVVEHLSDRVMVMYLGKIVESGPAEKIFSSPKHPYTKALLDSVPSMENRGKEKKTIAGDIPNPLYPPSGCSFRTRCLYAKEACSSIPMELEKVEEGHWSSCPFHKEIQQI